MRRMRVLVSLKVFEKSLCGRFLAMRALMRNREFLYLVLMQYKMVFNLLALRCIK